MERIFKSGRVAKAMAILGIVLINIIGAANVYAQVGDNELLPAYFKISPANIPFTTSAKPKLVKTEEWYRMAAFDTLLKYSERVRETGRNNVHPDIVAFNKPLGIPLNSPYCSSCGIYFWKSVGVKFPGVDGRAYSWKNPKMLIWHRGFLGIDKQYWPRIKYMDAVICTWSHVEFTAMDSWSDYSLGLITGGCNTKGGRKVEGVYHPIYRPWSMIMGIYDHFTPYYEENLKPKS